MLINRRALYNSLRMNWVLDPTIEVEGWQVEDYRAIPLDEILERLEDMNIRLDRGSFTAFAEDIDSPEDLTEALLQDSSIDIKQQDQVYLLIFELWRRLLPEKSCPSILCDELDHQIHLYDQEDPSSVEGMADMLANLQVILDENTDEGADPHEVFEVINSGCANDIESFLHDYISDQIDQENYSYATELLEGFSHYVLDTRWFILLHARLISVNNPEEANQIVKELINEKGKNQDLEFNLEALSFLVSIGNKETFTRLAKESTSLLQIEDDFQTLVSISADFYHRLDKEEIEKSLQNILIQRKAYDLQQAFDRKTPHFPEFLNILIKS